MGALTDKVVYLYVALILAGVYLASQYFNKGLNRYPGPFFAKFTNIWRFIDVYKRRPEATHIQLHKKYGDIVRLGPNCLSFADPRALKVIYGLNKGFVKSDFYPVQMTVVKGEPLPSLFSAVDEAFHARLRRAVNNAFAMSSLVQYEPMVDETTELFLDQTDRLFVAEGKTCDFSRWLQFYAFDVIGSITYSKRHGFVEKNEDIDGIIAQITRIFDYAAPIGQMPWLDKIFWKNPIGDILSKWNIVDNSFAVSLFARARMQERMSDSDLEKVGEQSQRGKKGDLLSMFLYAQEAHPEFMTPKRVLTMTTSMAFAGSETTAISLASVFYFALKTPGCMQKLLDEIDNAVRDGVIEDRPTGLVSWTESQKLPYLDACIKEAFRMHPAAGLPLERITPPQGIEICGEKIPGGTIVGCSAWAIHRRPEIFGNDVEVYRPERWLEAEPEKLKIMNGTMFQFGAGSRTCIGKNISLMEIYKLVPSFLRRFEVGLANPNDEWKMHNAWFIKQLNFNTKFQRRLHATK